MVLHPHTPAFPRWRQADWEFRAILVYTESSGSFCVTRGKILSTKQKRTEYHEKVCHIGTQVDAASQT